MAPREDQLKAALIDAIEHLTAGRSAEAVRSLRNAGLRLPAFEAGIAVDLFEAGAFEGASATARDQLSEITNVRQDPYLGSDVWNWRGALPALMAPDLQASDEHVAFVLRRVIGKSEEQVFILDRTRSAVDTVAEMMRQGVGPRDRKLAIQVAETIAQVPGHPSMRLMTLLEKQAVAETLDLAIAGNNLTVIDAIAGRLQSVGASVDPLMVIHVCRTLSQTGLRPPSEPLARLVQEQAVDIDQSVVLDPILVSLALGYLYERTTALGVPVERPSQLTPEDGTSLGETWTL